MRLNEEQERSLESVSEIERKKMKETCMSAIMVLSQNRNPIKKIDLNRLVLGGARNYRAVNAITIEANRELYRLFGMRLYELDDKSKYLLVNSSTDYSQYAKPNNAQQEEFTVLYFILIDIFASSEEKISEPEMLSTLSALDIADVKKHIDTLLKKLYISQIKDPMHQDTKFYTWGPRAEAEVEPDKFFQSFLDLTEDKNESHWPEEKRRVEKLKSIPNRRVATLGHQSVSQTVNQLRQAQAAASQPTSSQSRAPSPQRRVSATQRQAPSSQARVTRSHRSQS